MSPRIALAVAVITITGPLTAQSLREQIRTDLFTFGNCGEPLCLAGALPGHGSHFIPATQSAAGDILDLLGNSLAASVANTPVGATSSGVTYQFVGGMPVKRTPSKLSQDGRGAPLARRASRITMACGSVWAKASCGTVSASLAPSSCMSGMPRYTKRR